MSAVHPIAIEGFVAAAFTPIDRSSGAPDFPAIDKMVRFVQAQGTSGLYVLGTTGEGVSFDHREREQVLNTFVEASRGKTPVIVNVGHDCLSEAAGLARAAGRAGASAISATPPMFFKPANVEVLIESMAVIAGAVPELPFYYYHVPQRTGMHFEMARFLEKANERIPNLVGVKFSYLNPAEFQLCQTDFGDRYAFFWGSDETMLSARAVGAKAFIGSTYNYATRLYREILACYENEELERARQLQYLAVKAVEVILAHGLPGLKALMGCCGIDVGPVRLPLESPSAAAMREVWQRLESMGVTSYFGPAKQDQS